MNFDNLVNDWLIRKWLSGSGITPTRYDYDTHGPISEVKVITADAGWDCGCYSSWTREDDFVMKAVFQTKAGEVAFEYGRWGDFPSFIEELDEYRNSETCYYESEEYQGQY